MDLASFIQHGESHSDINMLRCSPVFARLSEGHALHVNYVINEATYTKGYYLANGICPQLSTIVKTICDPYMENKSWFTKCQERCMNDIERAFGVLQQNFAMFRYHALQWSMH
jgi:hypothetical protein